MVNSSTKFLTVKVLFGPETTQKAQAFASSLAVDLKSELNPAIAN